MRRGLKVIESGKKNAFYHMQRDEALLKDLQKNKEPCLHFYDWEKPTFTFGHFINIEQHLDLEAVKKENLDFAKRPTGGGITFHLFDLSFSLLIPESHPHFSLNVLDNYAFINGIVLQAIKMFARVETEAVLLENQGNEIKAASYFCMAKPTKFDLVLNGKKLGGAAERVTKFGLLHQGTVAFKLPSDAFLETVLKEKEVLSCMKKNSCLLLEEDADEKTVTKARNDIKQLLIDAFSLNLMQ
ncbi:MAG TPA: hypothetical protein PLC42_04010 [Parachlamydiaceae bacterium]|nr:hypothetical protein [Parachlamydiaceae bacterium]